MSDWANEIADMLLLDVRLMSDAEARAEIANELRIAHIKGKTIGLREARETIDRVFAEHGVVLS